jgi:hypothetical protein
MHAESPETKTRDRMFKGTSRGTDAKPADRLTYVPIRKPGFATA